LNALLLLDLDDTLLKNNIDEFLPDYLDAFSRFVGERIDPQKFVTSLMAGTQAMLQNRQPDCTLKEAFDAVFFPLVGAKPDEFQAIADRFYQEVFPGLRSLTQPIPQAQELVKEAIQRNYRLAITTNPLFPRAAVLQRLKWANLPAEQYPFELISSYETFHFTKPDPAYFAEVLGRLGWSAGPVVVIGDDFQRDIAPARKLGLSAYWVDSQPSENPTDMLRNGGGALEHALDWIDSNPVDNLLPDFSLPEACVAILRSTPAVLDGLTRGLLETDWKWRPEEGEWSVTEIICHLRDVDEEVNLPRLKTVIETANPFIAGQDTDPWAESRQYYLQDGKQAFIDFMAARQKAVALLEALAPADWERPARHAIFGPTTLQELVKIQAAHDRLHQQQVLKLISQLPDCSLS
jgi:HAD superfamily hydrolase (TIGR01549 family)